MPVNSTTSDEVEKFLGIHELPKQTQQVIENLSDCASVKEIGWFSIEKLQTQIALLVRSIIFKGKKTKDQLYTKFFKEREHITFYKTRLTLKIKWDKDTTIKNTTH